MRSIPHLARTAAGSVRAHGGHRARFGIELCGAVALTLALADASALAADLVLNELLYDPPGADTDAEYVELYNPTANPLTLAGCSLAFVNGSDVEHPAMFWTAAQAAEVQPGGYFVVGGAKIAQANAVAAVVLQNGPDAVWLLRDGEPIDRVAYGATAPGGEGEPALDAASASIGRVPDGRDTDDNADDFEILPTRSPGAPNAREQLFRAAGWRADPPWRPDAGSIDVRVALVADGYGALQTAAITWQLDGTDLAVGELSAARGDTAIAMAHLALTVGDHLLYVTGLPEQPGAVPPMTVPLAVGPGPMALNEVMARPLTGQPEWIELVCRAQQLDLTGWGIADAGRALRPLTSPPQVRAGDLVLVAADTAAVRSWPGVPAQVPCVGVTGGWPSLNNAPSSGEDIADEVLLIDPLGRVVDHLPYGAALASETGRSIERGPSEAGASVHWYASPGPPTPGRVNLAAAVAPPASGLLVEPNPFSPDGDGDRDVLHVLLHAEAELSAVQAAVMDLSGDRVCSLGADSDGGTLRQWLWDGSDARGKPAPSGAYVVVVSSAGPGGDAVVATWRALVALGRRR